MDKFPPFKNHSQESDFRKTNVEKWKIFNTLISFFKGRTHKVMETGQIKTPEMKVKELTKPTVENLMTRFELLNTVQDELPNNPYNLIIQLTPQEVMCAALRGYKLGEAEVSKIPLNSWLEVSFMKDFFRLNSQEQDILFQKMDAYVKGYRAEQESRKAEKSNILPFKKNYPNK